MKITNDTQLAAAKAHVASAEAVISSGLMVPACHFDLDNYRAAIAEYETRSVELTENELTVLKWSSLGASAAINASQSLYNRGFVQITSGSGIVCDISETGRAYLESLPKLRWEVWCWEKAAHRSNHNLERRII